MSKNANGQLTYLTDSHKYMLELLQKRGLIIPIFASMRKTCKIQVQKEKFIKSNYNE